MASSVGDSQYNPGDISPDLKVERQRKAYATHSPIHIIHNNLARPPPLCLLSVPLPASFVSPPPWHPYTLTLGAALPLGGSVALSLCLLHPLLLLRTILARLARQWENTL